MSTGYGQAADAAVARAAGVDAHGTKPIAVATLLGRIEALVADVPAGASRR